MFSHKHYVPILKAKEGDMWALRELSQAALPRVTPLIEIVPPNEEVSESDQLKASVNKINRGWGHPQFFADLRWRQAIVMPDGRPSAAHFFDLARAATLRAIPVTSPGLPPPVQQAIADAVRQDRFGVAVRLSPAEFATPGLTAGVLNGVLGAMKTKEWETDVILDFGRVEAIAPPLLAQLIVAAVTSVPNVTNWRTLTVTGSSFPQMATLNQGAWNPVPRVEWLGWRIAVEGGGLAARLPSYGDHGIGTPELPFTGRANQAAHLKYSHADNFLVWRGQSVATHPQGNGQMHAICASLIRRPEFAGASFSRGDTEIHARATIASSAGNSNSWRKWAQNHYMELVASQIATLP